jgi:hypothetical protein
MTTVVDPREHRGVSKWLSADWIALLVALGLVMLVSVRWRNYQWDFYMFYGSANDFLHGTSPYRGQGLSFYHPPLALYLYSVFARLPLLLAYQLWFYLRLVALAWLFWLWRRDFLKWEYTWATTLYFVLAYNAAIYSDLVSGNISTVEQLGLWLGFAALLKGRYARFCLCVILIAQFKLTPIFFSLLLLFAPRRPQWNWFALCCAGFVAVFSLNYILQAALLKDFFSVAFGLDERGALSAGTLAFIRDVFDRFGGAHFSDGTHADEALYLITVLAVATASLLAVVRYRRTAPEPDGKAIVYFSCVAYALMVPRMRAYSYILLVIPTLHLLLTFPRRTLVPALVAALAALVVFPHGNSLLPFRSLSQLFYEYLPLAAALGVWVGYYDILTREQGLEAESNSLIFAPPVSLSGRT